MPKVKKEEEVVTGYIVVSPITDREDSSLIHEIGKDVSDFDEERLEDLVARGLVKAPTKPSETE